MLFAFHAAQQHIIVHLEEECCLLATHLGHSFAFIRASSAHSTCTACAHVFITTGWNLANIQISPHCTMISTSLQTVNSFSNLSSFILINWLIISVINSIQEIWIRELRNADQLFNHRNPLFSYLMFLKLFPTGKIFLKFQWFPIHLPINAFINLYF